MGMESQESWVSLNGANSPSASSMWIKKKNPKLPQVFDFIENISWSYFSFNPLRSCSDRHIAKVSSSPFPESAKETGWVLETEVLFQNQVLASLSALSSRMCGLSVAARNMFSGNRMICFQSLLVQFWAAQVALDSLGPTFCQWING